MSISNEVGEWMVVTRTDGVSTGVCGEMQMGEHKHEDAFKSTAVVVIQP